MPQPRSELTRSGLPFWAAAFVCLACIALIGLSAWHQWLTRQNDLQTAEVEMANLARSLTAQANDTFNLADTIVTGLANRIEIDGSQPSTIEHINQFLQMQQKDSSIRGVFIYDENGHWVASSEKIDSKAQYSDREYFQRHKALPSRETYIGYPLKSRLTGRWIVTVSRRLNHEDGSFAGVVAAAIDLGYFAKYYQQFDVGKKGAISLIGRDGIIMARSVDHDSFVGLDVSALPAFGKRSGRSPRGLKYLVSPLDGVERLCFFVESNRFPLMVVATRAKDELLASWWTDTIMQTAFVLALAALIALMGLHLIRRLVERQRMATALVAKEADFRLLAEQSSDVVMRIGADGNIIYASPSCARILGWTPEQLQGDSALHSIHEDDLVRAKEVVKALMKGEISEGRMVYRRYHPTDGVIWLETAFRATQHSETGAIDGIVGICRDVTEQKTIEQELDTLARSDALTGLANRRQFDEALAEEWTRATRDNTKLGLLLIDVDYFKRYNDGYGHQAGDDCLRTVAIVIASQAQRPFDLAARYGGEEFALLLPNTDEDGCRRIADKIGNMLYELNIDHAASELSRRVTVSVGGAAVRPADVTVDASALVGSADAALYLAKNSGRNEVRIAGQTIMPEAVRLSA